MPHRRRGGSDHAAGLHSLPRFPCNATTGRGFTENERYLPKILKLSIIEQRRSRVKLSGVVIPSPVGPAIENEQ